jgi:hypothetical protein
LKPRFGSSSRLLRAEDLADLDRVALRFDGRLVAADVGVQAFRSRMCLSSEACCSALSVPPSGTAAVMALMALTISSRLPAARAAAWRRDVGHHVADREHQRRRGEVGRVDVAAMREGRAGEQHGDDGEERASGVGRTISCRCPFRW